MDNFDLKKYLSNNPLLTEGQFSWFTQDTNTQIGSEPQNTITVYMHDNKGNVWREDNYEGYGEFGGKDYYELLDQMNGGSGDRQAGINLAFDVVARKNGEVLFPALTQDSLPPYGHDFTQEADHDPDQSWYSEDEDDYYDESDKWDDLYGDDDEEDEDY